MRIEATSVVVMDQGSVYEVHTYTTFDEAMDRFKHTIRTIFDPSVTEEELDDYVTDGVYPSDVGNDLYLVTSDKD